MIFNLGPTLRQVQGEAFFVLMLSLSKHEDPLDELKNAVAEPCTQPGHVGGL